MKILGPTNRHPTLWGRIGELDFATIRDKLKSTDEGEGWSEDYCLRVEQEYRRFLLLNLIYAKEAIVPIRAVDTFWHYHILDTRAYERDCQKIFGCFFHHNPNFGVGSEAARCALASAFARTQELYFKEFGLQADIVAASTTCSSSSCTSACLGQAAA